jgi:hypothetical protein
MMRKLSILASARHAISRGSMPWNWLYLSKKQALARQAEIDIRVLEISKLIMNPPGKLLTFAVKIISLFENRDPKGNQKTEARMRNLSFAVTLFIQCPIKRLRSFSIRSSFRAGAGSANI